MTSLDFSYVGKTEESFEVRWYHHSISKNNNHKYTIIKETGIFDYANYHKLSTFTGTFASGRNARRPYR